jgi:hypothetical protein
VPENPAPEGYRDAGNLTITVRFPAGPFVIQGLVLEHEECGRLVAPDGVGKHERLHPEGGKEAT